MSEGTVRRWVNYKGMMEESTNGKFILASDYDALRTQARELARALKESRREVCPFMYGSPQELAWLQTDREYQLAQAVLKEGA